MRHSDLRLTAKTYTDTAMLPIGDAVMKLPGLTIGGESESQKLVASGLFAVAACPKGEMVRDAGFEPAKRRWLSGTYGCSPTTGPTTYFVA